MNFFHFYGAFLLLALPTIVWGQCLEGDCINGQGTYQFQTGGVYKGSFRQGQAHGYGVCTYADGDVYEGWWENRLPHGKGKFTSDGMVMEGMWELGAPKDGITNVTEAQVFEGMEVQVGCLMGDCQNGFGIMGFPNGDRYEGAFIEGKFHGAGKWYYLNGDVFEGSYQHGYAHGAGIIYHDGKKTHAVWENGAYLGESKEGILKDCNKMDCANARYGIYRYADGTVYIGEFQSGRPHGWGRVEYTDGSVYEGDWKNDKANGYGTYTRGYEKPFAGTWKDGNMVSSDTRANRSFEAAPANTKAKTWEAPASNTGKITADGKVRVWAVIVGVSSYSHMPPLKYSDNDAFHLMAMMQSPAGGALPDEQVRVLVDEDATKANITSTMNELFQKADGDDLVMLYFSGHGLEGSFLPIDYDGYENQLHHREVRDIFDASSAKHKLCIADACHSGSFDFNPKGDFMDVVDSYYKELSSSKGGMALILSSKPKETSLESLKVRQGVFSHFLLRGMKGEADADANGVVSLGELYKYISEEVRTYTQYRQSPLLKGNYDKDMPVSVIWK